MRLTMTTIPLRRTETISSFSLMSRYDSTPYPAKLDRDWSNSSPVAGCVAGAAGSEKVGALVRDKIRVKSKMNFRAIMLSSLVNGAWRLRAVGFCRVRPQLENLFVAQASSLCLQSKNQREACATNNSQAHRGL